MKNIYAAVLAGGSGSRFGADRPKQFMTLGGTTLLRRSLLAFGCHPDISGIVLVAPAGYLEACRAEACGIAGLLAVVPGGETRTASTAAAVAALPEDGFVLLHDAARPLVTADLISRVVAALTLHAAVSVAVPVRDTLYRVSGATVAEIPERSEFLAAQTPQAFELGLLRRALAANGGAPATDDAALVLRCGMPVAVIPGEERNFKITTPADLERAEHFLSVEF